MDVVLTPIEPVNVTWSLKDRLGRSLGTVSKLADADGFKIKAQLGSSLDGVVTSYQRRLGLTRFWLTGEV